MLRNRGGLIPGAVLILLGVLFLLSNLSSFDLDVGDLAATWWPMLFILGGAWQLATKRGEGLGGPLLFIGMGVVFQVATLEWVDWGAIWPAFLIVIGIVIILQRRMPSIEPTHTALGDDTIDISTVFNGVERRITSPQFAGGRVSVVFGGVELDLRGARLADNASLQVSVVCGGLELKVPEEWNVQVHGTPLLGSIEQSGDGPAAQDIATAPRLDIYASVTLGGLEIDS
jgi:predicted membrane protein